MTWASGRPHWMEGSVWKRSSHLHLAERGPLSPKQSEGTRVAFWRLEGAHGQGAIQSRLSSVLGQGKASAEF